MTLRSGVNELDMPGDRGEDAAIVREAKRRWKIVSEWESPSRQRFIDDIKFENGDSDNGFQWPNNIRQNRAIADRPCLTMNLTRQHNLQISNQSRKNKSSPKFIPQGNGATTESALIMSNIVRRIETRSNAQNAYTTARSFQIGGGIGWWRIHCDYVNEKTFDQDLTILPIRDALSVYVDPNCKQSNKSDAQWGFVFDEIPLEDFKLEFPEHKDLAGSAPLGVNASDDDDWISVDYVRVAEYFRIVKTPDVLVSFVYQGKRHNILKSQLAPSMRSVMDGPLVKQRKVLIPKVEWYLIAGSTIIDKTVWPGKFIPLICCLGEETVIGGVMDRKGHTRWMKDAQRMYNYNASSQVEFVALQGKTPWVAASQAIEEYESMWNTANITNHSVLVYNAFDDNGQKLDAPTRTQPPTASPAYQMGMETAFNQIMMVSGQWQNSMGMAGNERTGTAIRGRQAQAETSVFHFQDNYESALVYTATQLLDLIPRVYDTKRVISIQGDDEVPFEVTIDPKAQQAFALQQRALDGAVVRIFNPALGDYAISPSVGPSYGSKRQETVEMLTLLMTQAPQVVPIIGDIMLSAMDFDKASEAAQRIKRLVPPAALGEGSSAAEQQLQQQNATLQESLSKALQELGKKDLKLVGKEQMRDIDVYEAETKRMAALKDLLPMDAGGLMEVIRELVREAVGTHLSPIVEANANNLDIDGASAPESPPMEGAKKAPDGEWYVGDPSRPGKHLKVVKGA